MASPALTVRIAFPNNPADTAWTWTDVTAYVREFQTNRGRDDETRQFDTGAASIVLDNRDRRFDPSNTSSPYYPNVLPMKRVNIRATWAGTTYDLFTGFIEDFPLPADDPSDLVCQLSANDVFEVLNATTVSGEARAIERSDQRAGRILALAGLPAAAYSLGAGKTDVAAEVGETQTFTDASGNDVSFQSYGNWGVLDKLRELETAERGQLFVDEAGVVAFYDRHFRLLNQTVSQATFGDAAGELPLLALETRTGSDLIFNEARTQRAGTGTTVFTAEDTASQTQYLTRSWPSGGAVEQTVAAYDAEVEALAQFIVDRYKQPVSRISSITVSAEQDVNLCTNPSFEPPLNLTGWDTNSSFFLNAGATAAPTASGPLYGTQVAQVVTNAVSSLEGIRLISVPVVSGHTYTFSVYVWLNSGASAMGISLGSSTVGRADGTFTAAGAWTRVSVTLTATGTGNAQAAVYGTTAAVRNFQIDGVLVQEGSRAGPFVESVWPQLLGREIGDKLTVNVRYLGVGSLFSQASRIERVRHTFSKGERWRTTWALSPTSAYELASYWKLQDAASQLGTNTALAF